MKKTKSPGILQVVLLVGGDALGSSAPYGSAANDVSTLSRLCTRLVLPQRAIPCIFQQDIDLMASRACRVPYQFMNAMYGTQATSDKPQSRPKVPAKP
ncbi:hypothetical protein BJY04DRAFT_202402 [Aspergillus karnatakaensis]|uniref:uncharacterized protein n=1 Tax=Aspergillus karnatakaensis TaxID=1810916 RepID=UPI003CCDFB84